MKKEEADLLRGTLELLLLRLLRSRQLNGWEITVAAFAQEEGEGLCQIEVALYRGEGSLAGIAIRVVIGVQEREGLTDEGGVVIFEDVPIAHLNELVVHVGVITE